MDGPVAPVDVITPTLPERDQLRAEAVESVAQQTVTPAAHLVGFDHARRGPAVVRNRLAQAATQPWLAFLDDDDVAYPGHLETLLRHSDGADVVYTRGARKFDGQETRFHWEPDPPTVETLRLQNWIPVTALVDRQRFLDVGGFDPADRYEDWGLWLRMLKDGATFQPVDVETWAYRSGDWSCRTDEPDPALQA